MTARSGTGGAGVPEIRSELREVKTGISRLLLRRDSGSAAAGTPPTISAALAELDRLTRDFGHLHQQWQAILDALPCAVFACDGRGRILAANASYAALAGISTEAMRGRVYWRVFPSRREPLIPPGENIPGHVGEFRAGGRRFLYEFHGSPASTGVALCAIAEITPDSVARLLGESLVNEAPCAIIVTDPRRRDNPIVYCNQAVEEQTGYAPEELLGRNPRLLQGEDHDQAGERMLHDAIRRAKPATAVLRNYRKDGEMYWNEVHVSPMHDADGRLIAFMSVQHDVTPRVQIEERLREREDFFHSLADNSLDIITVLSPTGSIFYVSPSSASALGYEPGELIGSNAFELVHPDDREGADRALRDGLRNPGVPQRVEYRYRHKDGSWISLETVGKAITRNGAVSYAILNSRDVGDRVRMIEQLRRSRAFEEAVVEGLPGIFYMIDRRGRRVRWNRSTAKYTGYSEREVESMRPEDFVVPEHRDAVTGAMQNVFEEGEARVEADLLLADGSTRRYLFTGDRVDIEGEQYLSGWGVDITDLREAEQALRETEARFRAVFHSTHDAIVALDLNGVITEVNDAALRLFRCSRGQILGKGPAELSPRTQPDGRDSEAAALELIDAARRGDSPRFEWRHLRFDGTACDVEITLNRVEFGGQIYVQGFLRDITDRVVADKRLRESEQRLRVLFELAPVAYFLLDREGVFVDVNRAAEELLGYPRSILVGSSVFRGRFIMPGQGGLVRRLVQRAALQAQGPVEIRLRHRDGHAVSTDVGSRPVAFRGRPFVLGIARDVSERLRAEEAERESARRARLIIENAADGILVVSQQGAILMSNPAAEAMWGRDHEELAGTDFGFPVVIGQSAELELHRPDGSLVVAEMRTTGIDWGTESAHLVTLNDVTRRRQTEIALRQAATVFDHSTEGIMITDRDNRIAAVNSAFTTITGYEENEVRGRNPRILQSGRQDRAFYQQLWRSVLETGSWQGEIWNRRKNGEIYPQWSSINTVKDDAGEVTHYVGVFSDITGIKRSQERLEHLAHHDPLTDLPNRLLLRARIEHTLERARREKTLVAVLFLDIDRFKDVNDSLGHEQGDEFLKIVAERLQRAIRADDTVARQGGDEFIIVLEGIEDEGGAAIVAANVLREIASPVRVGGITAYADASIGISVYPRDGEDAETLIRNADAAMYRAKRNGGGGYEYYTADLTSAAFDRLILDTELRDAVREEQFELLYQPQVSLKDGRVCGVEALIRWRHPSRGLLAPATFIPVAERSGVISAVTDWVVSHACRDLARWAREADLPHLTLSINASAQDFRQPGFGERIAGAMVTAGVDPTRIELEVTEGFFLAESETTTANLAALSAHGIRMAVDDFGKGYSSLAYLKRLPVDCLKIDSSFVRDLSRDPNDIAIASAIVAMGHSLQMRVVAEGVEHEDQAAILRDIGCDEAQGYLFGPPCGAQEILAILRSPPREAASVRSRGASPPQNGGEQ